MYCCNACVHHVSLKQGKHPISLLKNKLCYMGVIPYKVLCNPAISCLLGDSHTAMVPLKHSSPSSLSHF